MLYYTIGYSREMAFDVKPKTFWEPILDTRIHLEYRTINDAFVGNEDE